MSNYLKLAIIDFFHFCRYSGVASDSQESRLIWSKVNICVKGLNIEADLATVIVFLNIIDKAKANQQKSNWLR